MLSTAKSANIGFRQVVQLFTPPTNPAMHLVQKITFINPRKPYFECQRYAHKYYGLLGFSRLSATL